MLRLSCLLLIASATLLPGCVSMSNLPQGKDIQVRPDEAIVVLGVRQPFRIGIQQGDVEGEGWKKDLLSVLSTNTYPDDGYIVVRLSPRVAPQGYGVTQILPEGMGGFTPRFAPCAGQELLTFDAPAGKVTYVGDLEFNRSGSRMGFQYSIDAAAAKRFVEASYPALANKLEDGNARLRKMVNGNCGPTIIPIFIK